MAGTRGPFHAPPQLKPRDEVKSGKKGKRVRARDTWARCVRMKGWEHGVVVCRMFEREEERRRKIRGVKDER